MNVVIPYCHKDANIAWTMAELLCLKTEVDGSNIYLYQSQHVPHDPPKELNEVYGINLIKCEGDPAEYPAGPNYQFAALARKIANGELGETVFLAEPDGFPTRADWYESVKLAHEATGALCSGAWVGWTVPPTWPGGIPHYNGNMVITRELCQKYEVLSRPVVGPWDVHHGQLLASVGAHNCQIVNPFRHQDYYHTDWWFNNREAWVHGCNGFQCWDRIEKWPDIRQKPKVYTYYETIFEDGPQMLEIWRRKWSEAGFNPVVLDRSHAMRHPKYVELNRRVGQLPTINGIDYERACYIRWLAFDLMGGGLMVDWDVHPRGLTEADLDLEEDVHLYSSDGAPCMVTASKRGAKGIIQMFFEEAPITEVAGRRHTSDMFFFQKYTVGWADICRTVGSEDETTRAIHFSQYGCREAFGSEKLNHLERIDTYEG